MDRRQQKTKIAIHQAMTTLLKKKKFEALTVQDIIDEANIGRSTFYSHFETKEELLEEICREMFAHVFSKDLAPEKSHDFSKGRKGFANRLTHILYHLQDHKENIKAIMYGETEKLFTSYFRDYLEQTFCDDLVAHSEVPKAFALQFFTGSFCETIKWWINSDMKMPPEEVVENYQKMIKFR